VDAITGFSIQPLRAAVHLGVLFGLGSLALLLFTLYGWLAGATVPRPTSLLTGILLRGSVQLLALGRLGDYPGHPYPESKHRPLFVIDRVVRSEADAQSTSAPAAASSPALREMSR